VTPTVVKRNAACVLLMLGIIAAWYLIGIRNSVSFWYADDDYAYLSLAHALSFEQWLRGDPTIGDVALVGHPGIPFYLASWIAFKIALPASAQDFIQVFSEGSDAADKFWLVSRVIALLLALGGVILTFRAASGKLAIPMAAAATILFLAVSDQSWIAMSRLGIESFALPYAVLFYLVAKHAFSDRGRGVIVWLVFGAIGGLGYSLKFHYVAFALGSAAGLMAMLAVRGCRLFEAFKLGIAYVIGLVLSFGSLAMALLGSERTLALLNFHLSIVTHSGYYGSGEADVVSPAQVLHAVDAIVYMPALLAALALVVAGAVYVMVRRWPDRDWRSSAFPLGVALLVALLLAFSAVLKHYQPHYLLVPISIVPLLLLYVGDNAAPALASRNCIVLAGALGVLALPFTLHRFDSVERQQVATEIRVKQDVAEIEARPLGPDEIRFWDYRVPAPGFAVGFVVIYAGSSSISEWYQRAELRDRNAYVLPRRPWRYAVLSRGSYQGKEDVGRWWGFKPGDRVELLRETAVVERPSRETP
jgi:hypothetical protein